MIGFDSVLGEVKITGRRWGAGEWVKGTYQVGPEETIEFYGSVQPAQEKHLKQLKEGEQLDDSIVIMSSRLKPHQGDDKASTPSDELSYQGRPYKVAKVNSYTTDGFSYVHEAICTLKGKSADEADPEGGD